MRDNSYNFVDRHNTSEDQILLGNGFAQHFYIGADILIKKVEPTHTIFVLALYYHCKDTSNPVMSQYLGHGFVGGPISNEQSIFFIASTIEMRVAWSIDHSDVFYRLCCSLVFAIFQFFLPFWPVWVF